VGEAKALQAPQPSDLECMKLIGLWAGIRGEVDHAVPVGIQHELSVELRPPLGLDLAFERAADVEFAAQPQFLRNQVLGAGAHPLLDVVAGDDEVPAIVRDAAHDDVHVRLTGVPVIDGDPVEPRVEIAFHLSDQLARKALEVGEIHGVLRRYDEAEVVPVILAALGEGTGISLFGLGTEQAGFLPVTGDAFAPEVVEMGS
jgi:hypothetical protein